MSEQTIYSALRSGGLSHAGACSMMGNMFCESALISNNVEDRCTLGDFDYTYAVDVGTISRYQFKTDAFGYGLCQWTYPTRKEELYNLAKQAGVSIGDEALQCGFCVLELKRDYANLYQYLCTTEDLAKATEDICSVYERPAVNNFAARINAAKKYYNQFANDINVGCTDDACPIEVEQPQTEIGMIPVRILRKGNLGRDVFMLQCGLSDMGFSCGIPDGDFGKQTEQAVKALQEHIGTKQTGIADEPVWQFILQEK